jgi:hypothetical protein
VTAWAAVCPAGARPRPTAATTLKPLRGGSAAHRLVGAGPGASDVIAKWTRRATVEFEHRLYLDLLPSLGVATVRCYGVAADGDEAHAWLFLEDAGGIHYSPERSEHRRLAARFLAALHTAAAGRPAPTTLPRLDAAYYRDVLERSRRSMIDNFGNPALTPEQLTTLRAVLRRCETVLDRWSDVERLCAVMPETLVHGDFVAKNVRVRDGFDGRALVAFDWETAGWGLPAIDLWSMDVDEYARQVRGAWPAFARSDLATVARTGRLLWFTSCIGWRTWALGTEWVWRSMKHLPVYERELRAVMAEFGWA